MSDIDVGHTYQVIEEKGYHRLPLSTPLLIGRHHLYWNKNISAVLRHECFDVILVPGYAHPTALAAAVWAQRHGTPFIYTADSTLLSGRARSKCVGLDLIPKIILHACGAAWVPGRASRAYMRHYGVPDDHIFEGCYCLDVAHLEQLAHTQIALRTSIRSSFGFDDNDFVMLYAGRFVPARDVTTLVRGFLIALSANSHLGLILVGNGPDRQNLEQLAQATAGRVAFVPFAPIGEVGRYYCASDAYALTSVADPYSVGFVHAAICGLPLLCTTAVGTGYEYLLPGRTGLWLPVGDERSVASAICALSENRKWAAAMGEEAARIAATRTPQWAAEQLEQAIQCALRHRTTGTLS